MQSFTRRGTRKPLASFSRTVSRLTPKSCPRGAIVFVDLVIIKWFCAGKKDGGDNDGIEDNSDWYPVSLYFCNADIDDEGNGVDDDGNDDDVVDEDDHKMKTTTTPVVSLFEAREP